MIYRSQKFTIRGSLILAWNIKMVIRDVRLRLVEKAPSRCTARALELHIVHWLVCTLIVFFVIWLQR